MKNITGYGNQTPKKYKKKMHTRCLLLTTIFLSMVFLSIPVHAAVEVKNDVTNNDLWTEDVSPYVIKGKIKILEEITLTIEPGTIIQFDISDPNSGLEVYGTLDAQGENHKPILFTTKDSGAENPYWGHIMFTENSTDWNCSSGCILSNCIIEYGGRKEDASIICDSASPLIKNSIIRYGKADGIIAYEGIQNILYNRIHDTVCGIKLIIPEGGLVENNYLINNEQGIYLASGTNTLEVKNNTVKNSSSEIYGGCLGINLLFYNAFSSYIWEQTSGPEVVLSNPNDVKPTFTAPDISIDEPLTFRLTVTDNEGLRAVDEITINVRWENKTPVADAGPDQTINEGRQVFLDGSNSIDQDSDILFYRWEQTSDPNSTVTLSDPNSQHCTFEAPPDVSQYGESFVFQLTVTDAGGLYSKDTVTIHVTREEDENQAPSANAGLGWTVVENTSDVILNGSGSTDHEDGIILWQWTHLDESKVAIENASSQTASFTAPSVDSDVKPLTFQLKVIDDALQESTDIVIINVLDSNRQDLLPLAPIAEAGDDQMVDENVQVTLDSSNTVAPGGIKKTDWKQIAGPDALSTSGAQKPSFTAPNVTEDEELIFRLTVTDDHGLKSTDTVKVIIIWVNEPPKAYAGQNQTTEEGLKVILDGSGSFDPDDPNYPDHGIASYRWLQTSGGAVIKLSSDSVVKPVFTAPQVLSDEQLVFQLTVTDMDGLKSDSSSVIIEVLPKEKPPVADARIAIIDRTESGEIIVDLDGSESYDPEGPNSGIVSYLWEQTPNITVTLHNSTTAKPHFEVPPLEADTNTPAFQSLTFVLTVQDKDGLESSDAVIVNITEDPNNQMPTAKAAADQTSVIAGAKVTLDGSGSLDPEITSTLLISNNLFIHDDSEGIGNAIAISENQNANSNLSITGNNLEYLNGKFMVYLYDWEDESLIYDKNLDEYVPRVDYLPKTDASAENDLDYPPMADAGEDQGGKPDDKITLDGSGTYDSEGILSYEWRQMEGQTVTLNNAETIAATFIAPVPEEVEENDEKGILKFKLTVTDEKGFYDTDEVAVIIENPEENSEEDEARRKSSGCFISTIERLAKPNKKVSKGE